MGVKLVVVIAAVFALVGASFAAADVGAPAGFTLSTRLSAPASFVSGKHASVFCAATMAQFNAADKAATGVALGAGYSHIGGSQSFLSTWVCSYLNRWLAKKPLTRMHLAGVLLTLTHEAELERGISDESLADCAALAVMPQVVKKFFPLRGVYTIQGLMEDAWWIHSLERPEYLTHCPAR